MLAESSIITWAVPSGYPNPTRYPVFLSIPDPTRFSFENHRVNPEFRVLPDISVKPEVSGITQHTRNTQKIPKNTRKYPKYPKYLKIPETKRDTRKYPFAYFDTPTRPEPDPIPGILSNTRPDPTRYWKTLPAGHWCQIVPLCLYTRKKIIRMVLIDWTFELCTRKKIIRMVLIDWTFELRGLCYLGGMSGGGWL